MDIPTVRQGRFIPAGAGNTCVSRAETWGGTVHPRGRGEHVKGLIEHNLMPGSSPRARGTPRPCGHAHSVFRFIPAGAGNTYKPRQRIPLAAVHPRGRGEHLGQGDRRQAGDGSSPRARGTLFRRVVVLCVRIGSSPRARGTLDDEWHKFFNNRFIPAGAGNTDSCGPRASAGPVHPRGCGEHKSTAVVIKSNCGSSPRARGTLSG